MVNEKWAGAKMDRREMEALKQKKVVRVSAPCIVAPSVLTVALAQLYAMFGFASTLLATWEAIVVYVTSSLAKSSIRSTNSSFT
jgi:hypothetical protein